MAIRLGSALPDHEYWAMFVRNWGDEGFCSSDQHYLGLNSDTYTFRLPWKQGASDVEVVGNWEDNDARLNTVFYSSDIPNPIEIKKAKNHEGVQVIFKLKPPSEDGTRVNGQLHLRWIYPQTQLSIQSSAIQTNVLKTTRSALQTESEESDRGPEYFLGKLFYQMTPEQQNILLSNLPKENTNYDEVVSLPIDAVWVPQFQTLLPGQTFKEPTVTSERDTEKVERDNQTMDAWAKAFGSKVAFLRAFALVSAESSASRSIENQILHSGDSTLVTVTMKSNISQSLSLNETLPPGWSLTEISDGGADTFNDNVWNWFNVGAGETRTVIYRLNVPSDAEARTYYINGTFADYTELLRTVSGQNTIKVVAEIRGKKWEDLNANNKKDSFEANLSRWQINLTGKNTIENVDVYQTTTTDANGNYNFTNLSAGNYIVTETLQSGWVQTTPSTGNYTLTITNGSVIAGQDFGNFHKGKITGGGWIPAPGDPKATFGLEGQYPDSSDTAQGNVEYQDHASKLNIKSTQINTVATTMDKKKGVITGLAKVNGAGSYPFEVYVEDNGEPGKGVDVFKISLPTYPYSNGNVLSSGNIQIHK